MHWQTLRPICTKWIIVNQPPRTPRIILAKSGSMPRPGIKVVARGLRDAAST